MTCGVCGGAAAHSCIGASRCAEHCRTPQRHFPAPPRPPVPPIKVPMRQISPAFWDRLPTSPKRALTTAVAAGWPKVACTESCGPWLGSGDVLEAECWSLVAHVADGQGVYLRMLWLLRKTWKFEHAHLLHQPTIGHDAAIAMIKEGPR